MRKSKIKVKVFESNNYMFCLDERGNARELNEDNSPGHIAITPAQVRHMLKTRPAFEAELAELHAAHKERGNLWHQQQEADYELQQARVKLDKLSGLYANANERVAKAGGKFSRHEIRPVGRYRIWHADDGIRVGCNMVTVAEAKKFLRLIEARARKR